MPPTKDQQEAEGKAREDAGIIPGDNRQTEALDDIIVNDDPLTRPRETPAQEQKKAPPAPPPFLSKRDEIIQRFRTDRTTAAQEDKEDFAEFARDAEMPAEFRQTEPASQPDPVEQTEQTDPVTADTAPAKHKLKVHGQELELSLEEILAKAQIAIASENILDEVKSMKRDLAERLSRVEQPQHQRQQDTQSSHQQQTTGTDEQASPDQADPMLKLLEAMQWGDPAEAKLLLQNTIDQQAGQAAERVLQQQRLKDEGARTAKVLSDFKAKHADIAGDPLADAAIQTRMFQLQVEDMHALGVDPKQIRTESGQVTPADIAMAHRWYRANGYQVRKPEDLLDTAVTDFVKWKGVVAPAETQPAAHSTGKAPPRVEVRVERDARRAAIPQQPDRAAAPRPAPTQPAPQPRDRSSIVQNMIAARSAPRGKLGIA